MQTYQIEVEAHPTPHDGQLLADQLYTYNVEQTGYDDGKYLTLWVKSSVGERLAGLYGWTWGAAVVTSRTSGSTKTSEDRAMARNCSTQRNTKPVPVVATMSCSTRIAFRHLPSIKNRATRCLLCWKTIPGITGITISGNG